MKPIRALVLGVIVFLALIVLFVVGMRQVLAREGPAELIPLLGHKDLAVRFEAGYELASLNVRLVVGVVPVLVQRFFERELPDA